MTKPPPALRQPRLLGCLLSLLWLAMIPLSVIFLAAAYATLSHGRVQDAGQMVELGWWLLAAGVACIAILCSSLIINMRLRRLANEPWLESGDTETGDGKQPNGASEPSDEVGDESK